MHSHKPQAGARGAHSLGRGALAAVLVWTGGAACAEASAIQPYYDFVHWFSMGRSDLALEQFADDAVVVAGPGCTDDRPCIGKAAIRDRYLAALTAHQVPLPLQDQRFDGTRLRTRGEVIDMPAPHECATRLRGGHSIELRGGRIAALRFELDTSDPQTAAFVARRDAQAALRTAGADPGQAVGVR